MGPRVLIGGPVLLGFADQFDAARGDPRTSKPYPRVTPSALGGILLPFACPHCQAIRSEPVDKQKWRHYADQERGFSWCPACRKRYVVVFDGMPLAEPLPAGAAAAPAKVEREGQIEPAAAEEDALAILGAERPTVQVGQLPPFAVRGALPAPRSLS